MAGKRRDNKNRLLRTGEQQRADGRYMYTYKDNAGRTVYVYSWKLEPTDRVPAGKRDRISLREKEKEIQKNLLQGTAYNGRNMTVAETVENYLGIKANVRSKTMTNYKYVLNLIKKDSFGLMKIDRVKRQDAREWFVRMKNTDNRSYSSIKAVRSIVKPAFDIAIENGQIGINPFDFPLGSVISDDREERQALTYEEKEKFLEFVRNDKRFGQYYDAVSILFHTGLRISEFCGLTIQDVDPVNRRVNIERQLQRAAGKKKYMVEKTKTEAGKRVLAVTEDVCRHFENMIRNRKKPEQEPVVDGISGFISLDKNGMPTLAMHWEKRFKSMVGKYNSVHETKLPRLTPHICRHTYATLNAGAGMNPKILQYLMGHSKIGVTMDVYTHMDMNGIADEVAKIGSV